MSGTLQIPMAISGKWRTIRSSRSTPVALFRFHRLVREGSYERP